MRRNSPPWITAAVLFALAAGFAFFGAGLSLAQDEERFIDLAVKLEVHAGARSDSRTDLYASNLGNQTAYDVEVEFEQLQPSDILIQVQRLPVGTIDADLGLTGIASNKFKWSIPVLPPQTEYLLRVDRYPGTGTQVLIHEATIKSTTSHESPDRMDNNSARVWETWNTGSTVGPARPFYSVLVSADNRHPSPGDTVNFTVTASQPGESDGSQLYADACINVWLTTGLTAGTPTFDPSGLTDLAYDTSDNRECGGTGEASGVFKVDGPHPQSFENLNISMILPVTVDSNAKVNEQCLTAELFAIPPAGAGRFLDDPSDNRAEYCFGSPPIEVFDEGEVSTWTIFACKDGVPDNECDTAEEVDVRVFATIEEGDGHAGHGHGGTADYHILDNATALIHVKDEPGRVFDADDGSLTDGTTVSWQTATDEDEDFTGTRAGVKTILFSGPVKTDYDTNWKNFRITYTASGLDGGNPPGHLHVRDNYDGSAYWKLTSSNNYSFQDPFDLTFSNTGTVQFLEFSNLGTYVLDTTAFLKHAAIDDNDDGEKDIFSGTGRSIFHVGPIAELGVSDGGPSGDTTTDQVAFAVVGINNRDEDAESGKIVVELPAGTTGLTTVPSSNGAFDGDSSPPTWTWDIYDLELADRRASKGLPNGVAVTLIAVGVSPGETATANVVYDPYEVCVASDGTTSAATTETACDAISGASWHSGTVFDINRKNNTATLIARRGGNAPGAPTLKAASVHTPAIGYEWDEIDYIYGLPVKHYETEWSPDGVTGWSRFSEEIVGTKHVDTRVHTSGFRYYRVRAVNQAGVPGPWSAPMATSTGLVKADAPSLTARASSSTAIALTWTRPTGLSSPVTGYELEVGDSSSGPWSDIPDRLGPSALSYTYSPPALTGGTRKYFRIRALTDDDASDWSRVAQATTLRASVPGAPRSVSAQAQGTDVIVVSWNAPSSDGGSPITQYEVQWHDGDGNWASLGSTMDGYTYTLRHSGLVSGVSPQPTYYYQVRARNSSGRGPWSGTVSARTRTDVPDAPILSVKSKTSTETHLVWDQYFPNPESSNVYRYELQINLDGEEWQDSWFLLATPGPGDRGSRTGAGYRDTSVEVGRTVWYRIRAVASNGNSSWSNVVKVTTPKGPPGPPGDVRAEPGDSNVIRLYWSLPYHDGGSRVWRYQIQASKADNPNTNYSPIATVSREKCNEVEDTDPEHLYCKYGHGGLKSGDTWHYRVRAENRSGWGPFSDWVSATVN